MTRAYEDAELLTALRKHRNLTQKDVAGMLNVSRIEHEDDVYLSTLRAYIEALGGKLEITARFPDGDVVRVGSTRSSLLASSAVSWKTGTSIGAWP